MKKRILSLLTAAALASSSVPFAAFADDADSRAISATVVRLDPSEASPFNNGEFEGWGTSIGWWANRIGHSDKMAQQAAELFYSEDGLSLDIVRYNVGGGDDPSHKHITRSDSKLPCFAVPEYNDDGTLKKDSDGNVVYTYNWDNDHDQMNVLQRIKQQNPNVHIEGYTNSPPWFMTKSGCSGGGVNHEENLAPENYGVFADFLVDVNKHMEEIGLKFDSYSPMNEPSTQKKYWGFESVKQEGNHVAPGTSQSNLLLAVANAYKENNIDTLVVGPEETSIDYSVTSYAALSAEAKSALGRIDTHSYEGSRRAQLKQTAIDANKNLWMSEVDGGWNGFGLADRIITDLNGMQASAWVIWDIIDSHKDSTFTDPSGNKTEANNSLNVTGTMWGVGMANHDEDNIELANKYYAYGQFTRYINPGDTIIASSNNTLAAYNKQSGDIKIVAVNSGASDLPYTFDLSAFTSVGSAVQEIRTNNLTGSSAEHWANIADEATLTNKKISTTLKAGTITTYVVKGNSSPRYGVIKGGADTLAVGSQTQLTLATNLDNATSVTWSVDNADVADISASGVLTAKNVGTVTVTAECGGMTFPRTFEVPFIGTIKGVGAAIKKGMSANLSLEANITGDVSWSVSDTNIASITADGLFTAKETGIVTINAEINGHILKKTVRIQLYTITGTASWGNDSNRPADSADYAKAADGSLDTYFDGTQNGWVQYDYGEPFKISAVKLAARSGNGMPARTVGGTVQGSNDGIEWTDLYKITSAIPAGSYTNISASQLLNNKAYRYYRYTNSANMTNIAEFLLEGDWSNNTPENAPRVTDLEEFTDDFESSDNIFAAPIGELADGGSVVFASGLDRFRNVFAPVKTTAKASLTEAKTLTAKDKFRLKFNMFAGWENNGKDNTFAIKDANGNEIIALYMTGGGYNFNQIRIGGANVLASETIAQSRSNPGTNKAGANGWNVSGQAYTNTVGYNKTVEITIDGTGAVSISATGGMADTEVSGRLSSPVSIKSIELSGNYNSAVERTVTYDNLDADIITYAKDISEPALPEIPENGELINLNFDNEDLTSTSEYGKAVGSPKFVTVDGRKCVQFDNTSSTAIKLTDANGGSLLTGQDEIAISFKIKPTTGGTSWWIYAAPSDSAQTFGKEQYLGAMTNGGALTVERYKNTNGRPDVTSVGAYKTDEWNNVIITMAQNKTTLYVNGVKSEQTENIASLSDILGSSSVAYIGRANWGSGEYATGYLDDFVITQGVMDIPVVTVPDLSNVRGNITLPATADDGSAVTWTSDNTNVITNAGIVTRPEGDSVTVTLTATITKDGNTYESKHSATVIGLSAAINTFAAYEENKSIKFTSEYSAEDTPYTMYVALYDENGVLVSIKTNTASGSFDNLANGKYKIACYMWNGIKPTHTPIKKIIKIADEPKMGAYLFAHFVNTEEVPSCEQIYFSVSKDGSTWTTLNGSKPMLTSTVGENGVRDPYILRGEDGKFFIIATDLSICNRRTANGSTDLWKNAGQKGSKSIVIWESDDLVNWSEARLVKINNDNAGCTWAPEAAYDPERDEYMVFWASTISNDGYAKYRIYRSYTKDFKEFSAPKLYIEEKNAMIDTTIIDHEGIYYRFTKDETRTAITMMKCNSLSGSWQYVDTYNLSNMTGYEGPTIYKLNGEDKWCLLLDLFSNSQGYKPFVTDDITKGIFTAGSAFSFDGKYRHGTVMPITEAEYNALVAAYPAS